MIKSGRISVIALAFKHTRARDEGPHERKVL